MGGAEILSFCFGGFPGTNRQLREVRAATGLVRHIVTAGGDATSIEATFFREELEARRPRLVIFGGWHRSYDALLDTAIAVGAEAAVLWTSSAVQTGLSDETSTLASLLHDPRIGRFFASTASILDLLATGGRPTHHLPPPLRTDDVPSVGGEEHRHEPPTVSLFCGPAEYRRKNAFGCIAALAGLDAPYVLHLNGLSHRTEYASLLVQAEIPHIDHGWMDDTTYSGVLDGVDIGLQVSLADSFNYVVAEHMLRAIPVLVSSAVPCAHGLPVEVTRRLVVDNPDDPLEIRAKLRALLLEPSERRVLGTIVRDHIVRLADVHREICRQTLLAALGRGG